MRPSLVATDLDGTFLASDGFPSAENVRAAMRCHQLGIPFVVATGRPARWLDCLDSIRDAEPYVLTSNGAVVFDLAHHEVVECFPIDPEVAVAATNLVRDAVPGAHVCVEWGLGWGHQADYPASRRLEDAEVIAPVEELVTMKPVVKLIAISDDLTSEQLGTTIAPALDGLLTCTWSFNGPFGLLEMSAPGVTKAQTLALLCEQLGADPAAAVAFGDMPNDLAMLQLVGHPYAMADAHPSLLSCGFPSAGHHEESGVGRTLMRLLDRF